MAGNARFHDKLHSKNHHTLPTSGYYDSASDPIASPASPFQGDFHINGTLSASNGIIIPSSVIVGNLTATNAIFDGVVKMDYLSGEFDEAILSDNPSTVGNGSRTLTLDFENGIYTTSVLNINSNVYCTSGIDAKSIDVDNGIVQNNFKVQNDLLVVGNLTANQLKLNSNLIGNGYLNLNNSSSNTTISANQASGTNPLITMHYGNVQKFKVNYDGSVESSGDVIGNNITLLQTTSSLWNDSRSSLQSNSAIWNRAYSTINNLSSNWNTTYNTVSSISSNWSEVYTSYQTNSGSWVNARTTLASNSGKWESSYNTLTATSANWNLAYAWYNNDYTTINNVVTSVNAYQNNWNASYTTLTSTSGNWSGVYTSYQTNSGNWVEARTTLSANSANWNETRTTVQTTSSDWLSGNNTLTHSSSVIKTQILSTAQSFYVPVTSVVLSAANVNLSANSPTYISVTNATGAEQFNLPTGLNSVHNGLTFVIKNNTITNNHFHVYYNGSALQQIDQYQRYSFIWNSTTWLVF